LSLRLYSLLSSCSGCHRDLHSFPTRRSSDLFHAEQLAFEQQERPELSAFGRDLNDHGLAGMRHKTLHSRHELIGQLRVLPPPRRDRKSTRLNSSHVSISYAVFCLKKKNKPITVAAGCLNCRHDYRDNLGCCREVFIYTALFPVNDFVCCFLLDTHLGHVVCC